jgi:hypothetical protein
LTQAKRLGNKCTPLYDSGGPDQISGVDATMKVAEAGMAKRK